MENSKTKEDLKITQEDINGAIVDIADLKHVPHGGFMEGIRPKLYQALSDVSPYFKMHYVEGKSFDRIAGERNQFGYEPGLTAMNVAQTIKKDMEQVSELLEISKDQVEELMRIQRVIHELGSIFSKGKFMETSLDIFDL